MTSTSPTLRRSKEGQRSSCWTDTRTLQVLETCSNNWNGQPYSTDIRPYASPCCTRSSLVKHVWGALTSNSSLQVEEATTASNTTTSAAAQTTKATPSSPAQSRTGNNSPQMQFCPPRLAPSSQRCHPPPNKFQNSSSFSLSFSFLFFSFLPVSILMLHNILKRQ